MSLLSEDDSYAAVEYATTGELIDCLGSLPAGCVLVDVPGARGEAFGFLDELSRRRQDFQVVFVSRSRELCSAFDAVRSGAATHVHQAEADDGEALMAAVARAFEKDAITTADVLEAMQRDDLMRRLSPREREVLQLLLKGQQNKAIAHTLGISPRTVEVHRSRMMKRLDVTSFAELIKLAVEAGLEEG